LARVGAEEVAQRPLQEQEDDDRQNQPLGERHDSFDQAVEGGKRHRANAVVRAIRLDERSDEAIAVASTLASGFESLEPEILPCPAPSTRFAANPYGGMRSEAGFFPVPRSTAGTATSIFRPPSRCVRRPLGILPGRTGWC